VARKRNHNGEPSPFKQDLTGILLIALALFILISNFSSSTGLLGLYIVKLALRAILGVGIYILPLFIALYGIILLFRHEIKELTVRLTGLLILFITFITAVQFYSPYYFKAEAQQVVIQGAGGIIGYGLRYVLERTLGAAGSYILLAALALIGLLLVLNLTAKAVLTFLISLLALPKFPEKKPEKKIKLAVPEPGDNKSIAAQMPLIKEMPKEVVSFPMPEVMETQAVEPKREEKEITIVETGEKPRKSYGKYKLPPLDLLDDPTAKEKEKQDKLRETTELRRKLLEEALASFGVGARVVSVNQGPAVTRYELQPNPGVKVSRIANLADDIALNLAAQGVRIEAPVPGKSVIGIEVPNTVVTPVRLKEIVKTNEFQKNFSKLFIGLGKDLSGTPIYGDLTKMPHLLIAGTTGSGKSVCINSLIVSILLRARPDEVKFIMIDPKMVELSIYNDIPHLLAPVVTEARRAALTLKHWVIKEMERRYKVFYEAGARNIEVYNRGIREGDTKLPFIVVIVDELADLMMVAAAEVETTICRLAQMARATGIHLVIATQRPSVDVITGLIKANIPSRIAFAVATQIDSRVILDMSGAEKLLGRGDMLYNPVGAMKPFRLQGSYVTDPETEKIIKFIKDQAEPEYVDEIASLQLPGGESGTSETDSSGRDTLFAEAAKLIVESQIASTSYLQRRMRIGYNRAARLMDEIEAAGIVSKTEGENKPRRILASRETLAALGIQ